LTVTLYAFKSPTIVCVPVNKFSESSFAVVLNCSWVIPPLEEIVSFIIVMLSPAITIFCFESSVSLTFMHSRVNGSSMVRVVAFISPEIAGE
jgi:ABC-type multidrug transport system permease subunit